MLDEMVSAYGNRFLIAAAGVSLALLGLFVVLWVLRHRAPSPFVRGGRNRQPRLQVLDAAAVDARRRLVLVRRDNIEHLIMIGGPTDIVIESGIGDERSYISVQPPEQEKLPEPEPAASLAAPVQQVTQVPRPVSPQPASETRTPVPSPEPATPQRTAAPQSQPAQQPAPPQVSVQRPVPPTPPPAPTPTPATVTAPRPAPASPPVSAAPAAPVIAPTPPPVAAPKEPPPVEARAETLPERLEPTVDDVFDAARKRVLSVEPEQPPAEQKQAAPVSGAFEKLLEAEMATHLDSVKASVQAPPRPIPTVLPPAPPSVPPSMVAPPVAATIVPASPAPARPATIEVASPAKPAAQPGREEPNLQTEIARIFGEMQSGRDK